MRKRLVQVEYKIAQFRFKMPVYKCVFGIFQRVEIKQPNDILRQVMAEIVQSVVPEAVPFPPRLLVQVTLVTPTLSEDHLGLWCFGQ